MYTGGVAGGGPEGRAVLAGLCCWLAGLCQGVWALSATAVTPWLMVGPGAQ